MYDIISSIVDHSWIQTNAGEQQYIYYTCCAMIILLTVCLIDVTKGIFARFWRA